MGAHYHFAPWRLAHPEMGIGIVYNGEVVKVGTPLYWSAGYLYIAVIDTSINICGVAAEALTGDSVKTCLFYKATPGNQFIALTEDTPSQANVGTIVNFATTTNACDSLDTSNTSNNPIFLIQEILDIDEDGTIDHCVGEFVDTVLGQDPTT